MRYYFFVLSFFISGLCIAQEAPQKKLRVYIDCINTRCDMTYIRTEINVVDFLLDRLAADVHIQVTSIRDGNGGNRYQLILYGQNAYRNVRDTLKFTTSPNSTDFERRGRMVQYLKLGLAPLVAKAGHADRIEIDMKQSIELDTAWSAMTTKDPWNYWVIRVGGNGSVDIDKIYKTSKLNGNVRLNRTTDDIKLNFGVYGGMENSSYEYDSDSGKLEVAVRNTNYRVDHSLIKTLASHWSYGYSIAYVNNTFSNYLARVSILPQIEYSVFPYTDVNNRFVTLRYGVGPMHNNYYDTTIYNKSAEFLWSHRAEANLIFNQKWGYLSSGIRYQNYLHDWRLNNVGTNIQMEVRVTGGLSFYIYTYGGLIHDQVYLAGGGATTEEVLSRRRALQSSFNFESYVGVNYRFGSMLNNFVNPRFNSVFD